MQKSQIALLVLCDHEGPFYQNLYIFFGLFTWNQTFIPPMVLPSHPSLKNLAVMMPILENITQAIIMNDPNNRKYDQCTCSEFGNNIICYEQLCNTTYIYYACITFEYSTTRQVHDCNFILQKFS